jgi:hypothetical protein
MCVVAMIFSLLAIAPATAGSPPQVLFNPKGFVDLGYVVQIQGTLAGEGVPYKNNREILACYRDIKLCFLIDIQASGMQVFTWGPSAFDVRLWTPDRVIADSAAPCGNPPNKDL